MGVVAGNRSSAPSLKLRGPLISTVLPFSLACVTPSAQVRVTYSKTDSLQMREWGLRGSQLHDRFGEAQTDSRSCLGSCPCPSCLHSRLPPGADWTVVWVKGDTLCPSGSMREAARWPLGPAARRAQHLSEQL